MQKRRGVIFVMYDLPVKTTDNRKMSEKFRKYLINHGYVGYYGAAEPPVRSKGAGIFRYVFLQKSIFVNLFRNKASMKQDIQLLR